MGIILFVTTRKPLAVWQNILLAIPVGIIGGAIAGEFIGEGEFVADVIWGNIAINSTFLPDSLAGSVPFALAGAVIGVLTFPIAFATVARTRNVLTVVPIALPATILSCWIGGAILSALAPQLRIPDWQTPWLLPLGFLVVFPVASMFAGCAWAAARERRRSAG